MTTEVGALVVFGAARVCHQAFVKSIEASVKFLVRNLGADKDVTDPHQKEWLVGGASKTLIDKFHTIAL